MKKKLYTRGITFFTTEQMYQRLKRLSDVQEVALSELIRQALERLMERGKPSVVESEHEEVRHG